LRRTQFVLDVLEQTLHERRPGEGLTHHSDRGAQYLSLRYTELLADAGLKQSVESVGDSDDNALIPGPAGPDLTCTWRVR
jgi:transposase InsO family protein